MKKTRKKGIAWLSLAFVVITAAGAAYLLYFPSALSNQVQVLQREGRDFTSTPVFNSFWSPAFHLHDSWDAYREYNHQRLEKLPHYDGVVWLIK